MEGRSLVEEEISLRRTASGLDGGRCVRELEVVQDGDDDGRIGDEGDDPHGATAGGAEQRQHLVDASQKDGPIERGLLIGCLLAVTARRWAFSLAI